MCNHMLPRQTKPTLKFTNDGFVNYNVGNAFYRGVCNRT